MRIIYTSFFFFLISTTYAQLDSLRLYTFCNSTFDHRPPLHPTPDDETTVPFWLQLLSVEADVYYASTGEFGFPRSYAENLPPVSQLGYDTVPFIWDSDLTPFSEPDFNNTLFMTLNYVQDLPPTEPYYGDDQSPIDYTTTVFDWVTTEEPGINLYLYELWPDMAPYLSNGFPPTDQEWDNYNDYLNAAYHDWFIEYNDSMAIAFPDDCLSMIPVAPVISSLLYESPYDTIPIDSLYEDDAPHGRPTIYFLAALISYMAIHETPAPASYVVPSIIHSTIRNNYNDVVDFIWDELQNFDDPTGKSRVFCTELVLPVEYVSFSGRQIEDYVELNFTTAIEINNKGFDIQRSADNRTWETLDFIPAHRDQGAPKHYRMIDQRPLPGRNHYRIKQLDHDGHFEYSSIIQVNFNHELSDAYVFPNPSKGVVYIQAVHARPLQMLNDLGQVIQQYDGAIQSVDLSDLPDGLYTLRWLRGSSIQYARVMITR